MNIAIIQYILQLSFYSCFHSIRKMKSSDKYKGSRTARLGVGYSPPPIFLMRGLSPPPPNISEVGAKNGLEFARGVEIHPLSIYLTNQPLQYKTSSAATGQINKLLETLDYAIDLYLYSAYAAHYVYVKKCNDWPVVSFHLSVFGTSLRFDH